MTIETYYSSSHGNLYGIKTDSVLLIEAGVTIANIKKSIRNGLSAVSGVLISHSHNDHSKAVKDLHKLGIPIYMTQETAEAKGIKGYPLHIIQPLKQFKVKDFTIIAFLTQHDCPGAVGFLINYKDKNILYATDTFYLKYRFKNLTHIMVECNFSEKTISENLHPVVRNRLYKSHFSLENVVKMLQANDLSKLEEIYLLHLSDSNSDENYFKEEIMKAVGKPVIVAAK